MTQESSLQAIMFRYDPQIRGVRAQGPRDTLSLRLVLGAIATPPYVLAAARAVLGRSSFGAEDLLFRYPAAELLDPGEELWQGVEVEAVDEVAHVPERAFEQLVVTAIRTLLADGPPSGQGGVDEPTRATVSAMLGEIEARHGAS